MTKIQFFRETLGITQTMLAEMLGVSQPAIANWENGIRKPDIYMLKKIADALGCTADDLLTDDPAQTDDEKEETV